MGGERALEDPDVSRAARSLRTVGDEGAAMLVERALAALHEVGESEHAIFYRAVNTAEGSAVARWCFLGPERGRRATAVFADRSRELGFAGSRFSAWNPSRMKRFETEAFLESSALYSRDVIEASPLFRDIYAPHGIHDQQRLLVVEGENLAGWIGLMRDRGSPYFSMADRRRLAALVRPISALVVAAARRDALGPNEPGDLVVGAGGDVEFASSGGRAWLERPGFADELREHVRAVDRGGEFEAQTVLLRCAEARCLRLDGRDGVRYLLTVRRTTPLTVPKARALSSAERDVAELAVSGATAGEIATMRGTSVGTVRNQLKKVYSTLGVGSRLELARALEGMP